MLEMSPSAATLIRFACVANDLGDGAGMRIFPSLDPHDRNKLRLRYVTGPEPDDYVLESGEARVFLAAEIVPIVAPLVLDTANGGDEDRARLVLRKGS